MGKSYTRFDNLEVTGEVKLPIADGSTVVSPDAAEAAEETPTKVEFDAAVALLNELKEKFNDLVTGFGGPEPAPTPERAPEIKETLIKEPMEDAQEIRETEPVIPDALKDTEPEEAGEPEPDAEGPETGDPDEKPDTEAQEAEEPEPEEEQAEAEAEAGEAEDAPEETGDATGDEAPEDLN